MNNNLYNNVCQCIKSDDFAGVDAETKFIVENMHVDLRLILDKNTENAKIPMDIHITKGNNRNHLINWFDAVLIQFPEIPNHIDGKLILNYFLSEEYGEKYKIHGAARTLGEATDLLRRQATHLNHAYFEEVLDNSKKR